MYRDIGWRNHLSVQRQGTKVVEKMKAQGINGQLTAPYEDALKELDTLFKAASIWANR